MRPAAQRKAVEHARQLFGISERRACTIFGVDRTSVRYAPRRSDDGDLRSRLREIAAERRRFGYRRLGIMLAREGLVMNHKKLLRLYREENLRVRRRRGRKRAMGTRAESDATITPLARGAGAGVVSRMARMVPRLLQVWNAVKKHRMCR